MSDKCVICGCNAYTSDGQFFANQYGNDIVCYDEHCEKAYNRIAALTTRLQEAEAIISYQYEVMGKYLTSEQISEGIFRRAAAWLKGGTE